MPKIPSREKSQLHLYMLSIGTEVLALFIIYLLHNMKFICCVHNCLIYLCSTIIFKNVYQFASWNMKQIKLRIKKRMLMFMNIKGDKFIVSVGRWLQIYMLRGFNV